MDRSFITCILEKANNQELYYFEGQEFLDPDEAKRRFYCNKILIAELQEGCYGSVTEQVVGFKRAMPHYFKDELVETKMKALDAIISSSKKKAANALQNFIAIAGFVVTMIVSLPGLKETFAVVEEFLQHALSADISLPNAADFSFTVWIILGIGLGVSLFRFVRRLQKPRDRSKRGRGACETIFYCIDD